jgi:hypothetical protein
MTLLETALSGKYAYATKLRSSLVLGRAFFHNELSWSVTEYGVSKAILRSSALVANGFGGFAGTEFEEEVFDAADGTLTLLLA